MRPLGSKKQLSHNTVNFEKIGEIPTKSIINEVKCNMQGNLLSNGCSVMIGDIYLLKE